MTSFVGAIDQGTTSTRFIVVDRSGQTIAAAQKEHRQVYPKPGWVEHDPHEIWANTRAVIAEALRTKNLKPSDLAAIGITNQRETTVLWDKRTGKALANAIVWQDTRGRPAGCRVCPRRRQGPVSRQHRPAPGELFLRPQARWLLANVPGARQKAEQGEALFGTIDTFLVWNLTGGPDGGLHLTDVTNASRTQLMHLETLDWDPEMLAAFGIPRAVLPEISVVQRGLWRGEDAEISGVADRRHPRRPAGRPGRPGLLRAGRGQEHLRHRLLPADEHRPRAGALGRRPAHHRRL